VAANSNTHNRAEDAVVSEEELGTEAAASFVVAAELPIFHERVELPAPCLVSAHTNGPLDSVSCNGASAGYVKLVNHY
jgi:hypothetical protein